MFAPQASSVRMLGAAILILVPVVVLLFGIVFAFEMQNEGVFLHWWIWAELLTVVSAAVIAVKIKEAKHTDSDSKLDSQGYGTAMVLLSITSGIGLVSSELLRASESWGSMGVTLFWAISAVVLTLWGLSRKASVYRYFGLALFVLCAGKVMLIDSTQLDGLQRILAYMGTGIMLLVLSFVYQKAASYFNNLEK